jgi:surfactin synthase thioesterase subunit
VSAERAADVSRWLLRAIPPDAAFLVFGFHYAGTGAASTYRDWPERIGDGALCPIQPPGRETRIADDAVRDIGQFAEELAAALRPHLDRPYAFVGHCGALPYMAATALALAGIGGPAPDRLFASSWGAPHLGPYGRLNFVDLASVDLDSEIDAVTMARFGQVLPPDVKEIVAEVLMVDLQLLRSYRYTGEPVLPGPVVVVSWSDDRIVPAEQVWPSSWAECAEATHVALPGDHWEFLRGPSALLELIADRMTTRPGPS